MEIQTNWSRATLDISVAILGVIKAASTGLDAWIELLDNGKQDYPIVVPNPDLNNIDNWTMSYGIPYDTKFFDDKKFLNDTEENLTRNYIAGFATEEIIKIYRETGKLPKGAKLGTGKCFPMKRKDSNDNTWIYTWKPLDNIPYWTPDKNIKKVFTVCTCQREVDYPALLLHMSSFLQTYANSLKQTTKE